MPRYETGTARDFYHPSALKAALAEFISVLIFIFAGEGSVMAFNKLTDDGSMTPSGLLVNALAHGFAIIAAVSVSANVSGGHVNPAITLAAFLGGQISFVKGVLYCIFQCLGSVVACLLLKFATGGLTTPGSSLGSGVTVWNALVFEVVLTFGLVYTVFATVVDPKKGNIGVIAPVVVGGVVTANIIAGAVFEGASMNPALSFGPAVVSWSWDDHWVYWVGPCVGASLAALVYDGVFIGPTAAANDYEPVAGDA